MRIVVDRSGLVESVHAVSVVAVDATGSVVLEDGEIDRPFFFRSSSKPFQAFTSRRLGAELAGEQLALACASHSGLPVHIAIVERMLEEVGLTSDDLRCPPSWPVHEAEKERLIREGAEVPTRIWHNCSGKHAGMLRACVSQGWETDSYLDPDHPLQRAIASDLAEIAGEDVSPVGIDGCGAPVFRTTSRRLAGAYHRLATDPGLRTIAETMHRYPMLVAGPGRSDAAIAVALRAAAKGGAEANIGIAILDQMAIGIKVWDGGSRAIGPAALAALDRLGLVPAGSRDELEYALHSPVLGGGRPVGRLEARWDEEH